MFPLVSIFATSRYFLATSFLLVFTLWGIQHTPKLSIDSSDMAIALSPQSQETAVTQTPTQIFTRVFQDIAKSKREGLYPKYLFGKQSYWTTTESALLNQEGAVEPCFRCPLIEPFLYINGRLITWKDVRLSRGLEDGYLPVPWVMWESDEEIKLIVTLYENPSGAVYFRYRLENASEDPQEVSLFVAFRSFQLTPPWNGEGGITPIRHIEYLKGEKAVLVNNRTVVTSIEPDQFGAMSFGGNDIVGYLEAGILPDEAPRGNHHGLASGALRYYISLAPGGTYEVTLRSGAETNAPWTEPDEIAGMWREKLATVGMDIEDPDMRKKYQTPIAHMLMNHKDRGYQPGPRNYSRWWIRDGSMICAALLREGFLPECKEFIRWYAQFQDTNGSIPAIVDRNGKDDVVENDSHGQFIYLVMQYYQASGDTDFLHEMWQNVRDAAHHIDALREKKEEQLYAGLVEKSFSHEGYFGFGIVHSLWDNFWAIRGLGDAALIAGILGYEDEKAHSEKLRDELKASLYTSIQNVMRERKIDYIPGAIEYVEHMDFDLPSTAIGVVLEIPGFVDEFRNEQGGRVLDDMLDKYLKILAERQTSKGWNFTVYEARTINVAVALGRHEDAKMLLEYFLSQMNPTEWNQYTEVNYDDPETPKFAGDMPHTWIGETMAKVIRLIYGKRKVIEVQ